MSPRSK
jgi:hypothetical protein